MLGQYEKAISISNMIEIVFFSYIMTFVNTIKFSVSYLYNSHVLDKTKSGKYLKYDSTLYYL
ncbi:hypothetical protein EGJ38_002376 [Staphylococcus aureus]